MKKALLPLAIAAALPMSALAAGPIDGKVYGKVNLTLVNEDSEAAGVSTTDNWQLTSNASRVGVSGKSEISEGLYAIYKAEFEINVDDGDKDGQTITQRNIYGGLSGSFGTVFAGKHDTVLKLSQQKVDLFNDLEGGDIKNWMSGETRSSNVINYTTPDMSGFSASVMAILNEGDKDSNTDGLFDSYSAGVSYDKDGLYLSIALDENVESGSQEKKYVNITRFTGSYKIADLTVGAIVQTAEEGDNYTAGQTYDEDSYVVSAAYKIEKFTLKAQYGEGEYEVNGAAKTDEEWMQFGVDYKLAKATKLFGYYANGEIEKGDKEETFFALGMEHKF